jgi:hypothetical protein
MIKTVALALLVLSLGCVCFGMRQENDIDEAHALLSRLVEDQ